MSKKYLYGATVQGVQEYIFKRSKLEHICMADANVAKLRAELFEDLLKKYAITDYTIIENGAGKIKVLFENQLDCKLDCKSDCKLDCKSGCQKVVREYMKEVAHYAPGITVSQAVVEVETESVTKDHVVELDRRIRAQRNIPMRPMTMGLMGVMREAETGLPVMSADCVRKQKWNDYVKLSAKFFPDAAVGELTNEFKELRTSNNFIAIVHIDGNGLTQVASGVEPNKLRTFDSIMSDAMTKSAKAAYTAISSLIGADSVYMPIRPIALAGDDLTIVCRADLALPYTQAFIKKFEELTVAVSKISSMKKLTACAGIAYVKSKFPYYYGYQLAEELCREAKKDARNIDVTMPPSCVMFHKVQDSFVDSYDTIIEKELTAESGNFVYGPYYINKQTDRCTVDKFLNSVEELRKIENSPIRNGLRKWISLVLRSDNSSVQLINRLKSICSDVELVDQSIELRKGSYPTYDLLSYCSILKL